MPITNQQKRTATKKLDISPPKLKVRGQGGPGGSGHVSASEITTRLRENSVARYVNGELTDMDGEAILAVAYTDLNDVDLPSAVGRPGFCVYLSGIGLHGSVWMSDGALYWPLNGARILIDIFGDGIFYVHPETAWTGAVASSYNSGNDTLLEVDTVAHGLTAANAEGSYLYISGTGWVTGAHKILDVDLATDQVVIDTPFTSQGAATIAVKNTYIPYRTITIPPLRSHSAIICALHPDAGGTVGVKTFKAELNSIITPTPVSFWTPSNTANTIQATGALIIQNINSTIVQSNTLAANNVAQTGTGASAAVVGNIETNAGSTLTLYCKNANANEFVGFRKGFIEVFI